MKEKKRENDENEYQNWYWHPASRRWRWHNPQNKARREQELKTVLTTAGSSAESSTLDSPKVYTQEECIRDLRNAFCKGRYHSWRGQKK